MAAHKKETFELAPTGDSIITKDLLSYEGVSHQFDDLLALFRDTDAAITTSR